MRLAVELNDNLDLFLRQTPQLEQLIQLAVEKTILLGDSHYCVSKFKKDEDIFQVSTAGRNFQHPTFRNQYDALTGRAATPCLGCHTVAENSAGLGWVTKYLLSGRYFFVTKMGFFGVAVATVRKNDSVTFLFGESIPIILQPGGLSYCMVGGAHVSGVMDDEVTGDMYESGLVEKRTFLIR